MEYIERQKKLQNRMQQQGIHGYLVTQNVDLYYFTGSMQTGYLFIPFEGEAKFYVRRSVVRAEQESASKVVALESFRQFGATLAEDFPAVFTTNVDLNIATEFDVLPVQMFQRFEQFFLR